MHALLALLLPLNLVHAGPVLLTSDERYLLYTKDEMAKAGYFMRVEGDKVQAESKDKAVKITMESSAKTVLFTKDGKQHAYDAKVTNQQQFLSVTHCAPDIHEQKSILCRTITADYCFSLVKKTRWQEVDLTKLKECGEILSRLDYPEDDAKMRNEEAMSRISKMKGVEMANFKSSVGKPRSLATLLDDYADCSKFREGWAPPSASRVGKGNRLESNAER